MKKFLKNHFNYRNFNGQDTSLDYEVKLLELERLLEDDKEVDMFMADKIPVSYFGNRNEVISVKNSGVLINLFEQTRDNKLDIREQLKHVQFTGYSGKEELIFSIRNPEKDEDAIVGVGVYDFNTDFLSFFDLDKYAKYCIKEGLFDLLRNNINEQLESHSEKIYQFRLLIREEISYIRTVTSGDYVNYNNSVAIYLILGFLHKISKELQVYFEIEQIHISDSGLRLYITSNMEYYIQSIGKVRVGLYIGNGEIKDKTFSCSLRYKFIDTEDDTIYFNAITSSVENPLFDIKHNLKKENALIKIQNINNLKEVSDSMIEHLKKIKSSNKLSEEVMYSIFSKIIKDKMNFSGETRKSVKDLYDVTISKNTYSLIKGLNMLDRLVTNIEERIFLEKVYYSVLSDIAES